MSHLDMIKWSRITDQWLGVRSVIIVIMIDNKCDKCLEMVSLTRPETWAAVLSWDLDTVVSILVITGHLWSPPQHSSRSSSAAASHILINSSISTLNSSARDIHPVDSKDLLWLFLEETHILLSVQLHFLLTGDRNLVLLHWMGKCLQISKSTPVSTISRTPNYGCNNSNFI